MKNNVSYRKHPEAATSRRQAELHDAVMTVRRLNGVPRSPLEAIKPMPCQS